MADAPPDRGSNGDTGTPRWVKVFGIIALVVVLLFLILMFARGPGGRHGPGRHMSTGITAARVPPSSVVEGHTHRPSVATDDLATQPA